MTTANVSTVGVKIKGWKDIELDKYVSYYGCLPELLEKEGAFHAMEGCVYHETEFLGAVVDNLTFQLECLEVVNLEPKFLAAATGIVEYVFTEIMQPDANEAILSIIKATIGMIELSKRALDYYGVAHFLTVDGERNDMVDLGDGYFYFNQC